jgi:hypothetical protein
MCNFRDVDWDKFRTALKKCLANTGLPKWIKTQMQLDNTCKKLMLAI